mgnify:CR=1 FL=1
MDQQTFLSTLSQSTKYLQENLWVPFSSIFLFTLYPITD